MAGGLSPSFLPVVPEGYWALAPQIAILRRELWALFPDIPRARFGTIGDQDHAARESDHNPDQRRYVRAIDVPHVGSAFSRLDHLAEFFRKVGENDSQRMASGGYVIWNRRKASKASRWKWITYMGDNPHTTHLHLSVSRLPQYYGLNHPWNVRRALGQ